MTDFIQAGPGLGNQYDDDKMLQSYLQRLIPAEIFREIEPDLRNMGERAVSDILEMGLDAEANQPQLIQYDPWGKRIDHIKVARGWQQLDAVSAEEGLIAAGYERKYGEYSRLYQFSKLYLFHPSSAIYTCPLAMTDGAARLIEVYGDDELKNSAYKHLTSRNPGEFWTSGQWMTEKTGGSDVGRTETVARLENGEYRLYGVKWFTSATTSQMAFTLARLEDENGKAVEGSRGLSLFYLELRDQEGRLNNIQINRLKDKLGTKALPTAELTLNGTRAKLVGGEGHGVKKISTLFNITRIYNSKSALSSMKRALSLARDYAKKREAFGKKLADHPLHLETLARLEVEYQAAFQATFHTIQLLGKEECGKATEDEVTTLRLLTPLIKLYTAKQGIRLISEILESFGGAGYVEDTGLPKFLRDAQVLSIWEGTTNILSLDALRAINKEKAFGPFVKDMVNRLEKISHPDLQGAKQKVFEAIGKIKEFLPAAASQGQAFIETAARSFAYSLFRTYAASLMLEHAEWSTGTTKPGNFKAAALRWCEQDLAPLVYPSGEYTDINRTLALGEE